MKKRKIILQNGIEGKHCNKCEEWQPLTNYYKKARALGGRNQTCKFCRRTEEKNRRKTNPDYYREQKRLYMIEYRKGKSHIHRGYSLNYKARKRNLPNTFTKKDNIELIKRFNGCFLTGSKDYQLDHIIPLKLCVFGTEKKNMLPLRSNLNMSKSDRNIFEWFEEFKEVYNLSESKFIEGLTYIAGLNNMTYYEYKEYVLNLYKDKTF